MASEQWQLVRALFEGAKDLAPRERTAYLFEACRDDEWARTQAHALLVAYDSAGDFIERPALARVAGLPSESDEFAVPGRRIGPYEIVREIGRGGMGIVYLAFRADEEYLKLVAIKLVKPGPDGSDVVRRFRQERQILANLEHPNIAGLLDGGTTTEGWPYVVMEYVVGVPITDYCDKHTLSVTDRLELFLTVCAAIACAHRNLVIHRDLKPSNILVTENAVVKLLDFGIAKLLDDDNRIDPTLFTRTGLHLMTPDYASPEQVRGEVITTASDVYSLGVVLYELLTGHRPYRFRNRSLGEIERVISEQEPERPSVMIGRVATDTGPDGLPGKQRTPQSVSRSRESKPEKLRGRLAGDLDNILLMALRKEVHQRYQSVEQLSADIRRHLQGGKVLARKHTIAYRIGKFVRSHRVGVGAMVILILTLLAGITTTSWQARKATEQVRVNRRLLYAAQMNLGEQAWETANIGRLRDLVENQSPQPGEEDLRGFEWYYLWRLYHHNGVIHTLEPTGRALSIAFSADGSKLVAASNVDGFVKLWDLVTGHELSALSRQPARGVWCVALSRDGSKLATAGGDPTAEVWDAATGQVLITLKGLTKRVSALAFSPDGKHLATASDEGTVKIWDAATGRELRTFDTTRAVVWSVAFSPDGKRLAVGTNLSVASIWEINTGEEVALFKGHNSDVGAVAWSPDSRLLATGSADRTIRLWEIVSGQEVVTLKGHAVPVWSVAFSPDGKQLATCSDTVMVWDIATVLEPNNLKFNNNVFSVAFSPTGQGIAVADESGVKIWNAISGQEKRTLEGHTVTFSPDGSKIATAGLNNTAKLWDAATGQELMTFKGHSDVVYAVKFSPDGQRLLTGSDDRTAKLWDAATGQELIRLYGHANFVRAVAFSPDGSRVATGSFDRIAKVWDAATGRELATLIVHQLILSIAFSPDGKTLATGSDEGTVKLWQVSNGLELATFKGHAGVVRAVTFSPDGTRLATGGSDGLIRLWDVRTGQELIALKGHTDGVLSLAFSPDGLTIVSGSADGTVRFWRAASVEDVAALARK